MSALVIELQGSDLPGPIGIQIPPHYQVSACQGPDRQYGGRPFLIFKAARRQQGWAVQAGQQGPIGL
jgi:hypothetical protein